MTDKVIVFVNCESKEQAAHIAQTLVGEGLAACVSIIPGVRSCYVWNGKMAWSDEATCMIKTTRGRFDEVRTRVKQVHSYSVPEIVSVGVDDATQEYLDWIDENVGG